MYRRSSENFLLFPKETGAAVCAASGTLVRRGWWLIGVALPLMLSCSTPDWYMGVGGKYKEAEIEMLRGRSANLDKAIASLQLVVQDDPTYRNSLTMLGWAYYRKKRYREAYAIIQRALAVNKNDEFAWLTYGLAQMRLGENAKGLESIKGGLTLMAKAMGKGDYRGYEGWDPNGSVRNALNRAVFQALKGVDGRTNLVRSTERLLSSIDNEEWYQQSGKGMERMVERGSDS